MHDPLESLRHTFRLFCASCFQCTTRLSGLKPIQGVCGRTGGQKQLCDGEHWCQSTRSAEPYTDNVPHVHATPGLSLTLPPNPKLQYSDCVLRDLCLKHMHVLAQRGVKGVRGGQPTVHKAPSTEHIALPTMRHFEPELHLNLLDADEIESGSDWCWHMH